MANPSPEKFRAYLASVRSTGTARQYVSAAERFLEWCNASGWPELRSTPTAAVAHYCAALVDAGYMPASVQLQMAGVRRYLKWARMQDEKITLFHDPEMPRNHRRVRDSLNPELLSHYFRLAHELDEPVRTASMLLPCSGLRGTEMVTLPLNCLRRVAIRLRDGTEKVTMAFRLKGKGGDERTTTLTDEGAEIIAGYVAGWRRTHPDTQWLFPGAHGSHLGDRTLRSAVQRIREPLKLKFTAHTMRRTYLTTLYRRGVPAEILAKIAGHKNVNTLVTNYLDLDEVDLASAVHNTGGRLAP